ncbi:MAG: glycosyltransferase family 2 protein [Lachnospiraceae bacterium]|nr:glycosyltransferase family 2 protein [Lachnospiraceae bacterium]
MEYEKKKISVVIPVYNAEKFIKRTMESIHNQTYSNWECLLVNNNSTDKSEEIIISQMAEYDDGRFSILHESKKGPAFARNCGIEKACGEFLVFVDADDIVETKYLENLVNAFDEDIDMCVCGYKTHFDEHYTEESPDEKKKVRTNYEMIKRLFETKYYQGYLWNKMFRKEVIDNNQLRFSENISFNEDRLFLVQYLLDSEKVKCIDDHLYIYWMHDESLMSGFREGYSITEKETTEFAAFLEMLKLLEDSEELYKIVEYDMIVSELRMFKRIIGPKSFFAYRKNAFRKYAKDAAKRNFSSEEPYAELLFSLLKRYAATGCTYTRNPQLFDKVGVL